MTTLTHTRPTVPKPVTHSAAQRRLAQLLKPAGVMLNGTRPWDITLYHPQTCDRILREGSLGLGESYVEGWWDCERVDELVCRMLRLGLDRQVSSAAQVWLRLRAALTNPQSIRRAWQVAKEHYDLDNDLFDRMLDDTMSYSCGYWAQANTLEQAQQDKLALICAKLQLQPGMRLLDIGCGWGSLMRYACEHHGVVCVGITVSKEQQAWAQSTSKNWPVRCELTDYRQFNVDGRQRFDRVASVGMFEHVGRRNYRTFFQVARRSLANDGLLLLHTIGQNQSGQVSDPWIERYIFPNGVTPAAAEICTACEQDFVVEDLHNFGADYDKTLMAWLSRFDAAWPGLQARYPERFRRMWRYYLMACAGSFRARHNQLWQWVMSPHGRPGAYRRPAL
jgi:cyclopropane-fatty-acyl-phospholipid synthase